MDPAIFERFERLFDKYPPDGRSILEIGATHDPAKNLLTAFQRRSPAYQCVGINLQVKDVAGLPYRLLESNANDMSIFASESFDAVLCNAVLEHDRRFWRTLHEVRRVLKPGGLFYVGVPGFPKAQKALKRRLLRMLRSRRVRAIPALNRMVQRICVPRLQSTHTFVFHAAPSDFYRFSEEAVREVFLEDMEVLHLEYALEPVRILGVGRKPASAITPSSDSSTSPATFPPRTGT